MNNSLVNMEDILSRQISGFHQYILSSPIHLNYVSQNFCEMVGFSEEELLHHSKDIYSLLVHPLDRDKYFQLLQRLTREEQTLTEEYRLLKKDGSVIWVRDMIVSQKSENGTVVGNSVLTDITELKSENHNLRFLNETIPCGFMKYTCEKQPKVTYINQKMIELLRFPEVWDGELDYLELYKSNIFLMIPMEERPKFSKYLNRVYAGEAPVAGEMTLLRCDGTRAHVFGWVTKIINEQGIEEFQSVCMDITERHHARKAEETKRYIKALTEVYDKIFEFNISSNMVKCLHCSDLSAFKKYEGIGVQMDDAWNKWLLDAVDCEDQGAVQRFFMDFYQRRLYDTPAKPPQITYRARSATGEVKQYAGVFVKVDEWVSFYCCRELRDTAETVALRNENDQLKENMKDLVMHFSDGIAAFEVSAEGLVKPLYVSENACEFFGYSRKEWLPLTQQFTTLESFVAYSEASYEDFAELLRRGQREFTYFDYKSEKERKIRAICSQREPGGSSSRYIMLYDTPDSTEISPKFLPENRIVSIRTFGYFDVFVGDKPIAFRNKKSKELFAILVDRRGGYVSSQEAIAYLWEDESANAITLSRYRKVALRLKNTLEEYGISDVIETIDGKRRIVMEKVYCDLYNYLSGKEEYAQLFKGNYLTNYSWAETTLGTLAHSGAEL